jgi:hypothetical protein
MVKNAADLLNPETDIGNPVIRINSSILYMNKVLKRYREALKRYRHGRAGMTGGREGSGQIRRVLLPPGAGPHVRRCRNREPAGSVSGCPSGRGGVEWVPDAGAPGPAVDAGHFRCRSAEGERPMSGRGGQGVSFGTVRTGGPRGSRRVNGGGAGRGAPGDGTEGTPPLPNVRTRQSGPDRRRFRRGGCREEAGAFVCG